MGAAWARLGWAVTATATAFCSFSVGPYPPVQSVSVHVHIAAVYCGSRSDCSSFLCIVVVAVACKLQYVVYT